MSSTPLPDLPSVIPALIERYKGDPESVYNTWFIGGEERMKAFGAIRRGVRDTVDAIAAGTFGNDYRGSPLETVLMAITEQKQVFEGAAHPFYWKPKLRIPDIYENESNKQKFGAFLHACQNATREEQVLDEISRLAAASIKGLGPAVASIVYFLHPTLIPPFNTAIINGLNALFGTKHKLGSWPSYLTMREAIVQANLVHRNALSKDLGAFTGLLFEIGSGRLIIPNNADAALRTLQANADKLAQRRHLQVVEQQREDSEHTQVQHMLIRIGRALNYKVYVARNDRHRSCHGEAFALLTTDKLPDFGASPEVASTVGLIDVIWLSADATQIVCAFEIEKSTSIYSGILRMKDLARSLPHQNCHFYLVAPDKRKHEVMAQMSRPALRDTESGFPLGYIPFELLKEHCDALCRFGDDLDILKKIADFGVPHADPVDTAACLP